MKSLLIFTFPFLILLGNLVNATKLAEPVTQISARDRYQGGWPLALMASDTACPAEAPVSCQNVNTNLECCPAGQFCHIPDSTSEQYCCPTESDCRDAVQNFLVCANSSWILYQGLPNYFCCEPGYIATERNQGGPGFCEPADVDVPSNKLAPTISQYTAAASTPASTATATAAAATSTSETTETQTAITGTITTTAGGVSTDTTTPTGSVSGTANAKSLTSIAVATTNNIASSAGSTSAMTALSVQTSAIAATLSTVGNPGSGSVSTSASASVKTATNIGASNKPAVIGIMLAFSFGVGVLGLVG